jgi:hypothetical protein
MTLQIPFDPQYGTTCPIPSDTHLILISAIRHQNLLGWDLFLCGFTSNYWNTVFYMAHSHSSSTKTIQLWDQKLVEESLNLYQFIWTTRNIFLHGTTKLEAEAKLRDRVLEQVNDIYKNPPKLHKRFRKINSIPLPQHLKFDTLHLQRWIQCLKPQSEVSKLILARESRSQLSLCQAYKRANMVLKPPDKYPP